MSRDNRDRDSDTMDGKNVSLYATAGLVLSKVAPVGRSGTGARKTNNFRGECVIQNKT